MRHEWLGVVTKHCSFSPPHLQEEGFMLRPCNLFNAQVANLTGSWSQASPVYPVVQRRPIKRECKHYLDAICKLDSAPGFRTGRHEMNNEMNGQVSVKKKKGRQSMQICSLFIAQWMSFRINGKFVLPPFERSMRPNNTLVKFVLVHPGQA